MAAPVDPENLRQVAIQTYRHLMADPRTAPAAYGITAAIIRQALNCQLHVCCHLLDEWLLEERL